MYFIYLFLLCNKNQQLHCNPNDSWLIKVNKEETLFSFSLFFFFISQSLYCTLVMLYGLITAYSRTSTLYWMYTYLILLLFLSILYYVVSFSMYTNLVQWRCIIIFIIILLLLLLSFQAFYPCFKWNFSNTVISIFS